jgi:hypothetical protein
MEGSFITLQRGRQPDAQRHDQLGRRHVPGEYRGELELRLRASSASSYRYSPWHDQNMEVGFLLGLHYTDMKMSIASATGTISQEASVKYPLPTLGMRRLLPRRGQLAR